MEWGKWAKWSWTVFWNLIHVVIVLLVFGQIHDRSLTIIVAILGLLFAAVVQSRLALFLTWGKAIFFLVKKADEFDARLNEIKQLIEHKPSAMVGGKLIYEEDVEPDLVEEGILNSVREAYAAEEKSLDVNLVKGYINAFFSGVVALICLFQLFTKL